MTQVNAMNSIHDYSKLRGKIAEKYGTQRSFSKDMDLSERSVSLKMQGSRSWTQDEMERASTLLGFPISEIPAYFFTLRVQPT